jgi:flagellar motor switch/type III secretory pathway protein FliN
MSEPTSPTADAVQTADQAGAAEAGPPVSVTPPTPPSAAVATPAKAEARRPAARPSALTPALPPYTRSLLHIQVPVVVTLAKKRQALGRIVELGPGSIIQFEKSCEELLELSVGDRPIASGEAVKVGDKFGLRILSITLPGERFHPVKRK